ncbi:uncharacterized protein METZ01_LOCUS453215, partial [marine metagenome]
SGLAAAYFYQKEHGSDKKVLILDNHNDFGGHAKRNEHTINGSTLLGYGGSQTLVRLEGTIDRAEGYHRVTWETEKAYYWSNGMAADVFKVVNPASYSKNGKVYTMFGPLPEMKGRTVVITAHYYGHSDTIRIHLL